MDEICNVAQLALADSETFDEVFSYSISNNYVTYSDSSGEYGKMVEDEEYWAPDGSGHAVTITWNPDENGNYTLGEGLVNDMTFGNGSVGQSRTVDEVKQCYLKEMGSQKFHTAVQQSIGAKFAEKSATYKNSSYTMFIRFNLVDGIYRADVYGQFNGTNLLPDSEAAIGSGTETYTPEELPQPSTPQGGTQTPNFSNSDLQGSGGGGPGGSLPSYKQCIHKWNPSEADDKIHTCEQCGQENEHEYEITVDSVPSCTQAGSLTKTCPLCNKTETEIQEAKHTFDGPDDLTCNVCGKTFRTYTFKAYDYDSKTGSTTKTDAHVVIPETFTYRNTNYKVTAIGSNAFEQCTNLITLVIPQSVISIGDTAFYDCTSLQSLNIPEGVTDIATRTFWNCTSLDGVVLPSTLKTVGYESFRNCKALQSIIIPEGVTQIKCESAFYGCSSLKSAYIPSTINTTICGRTFSGCSQLTDIRFGGTVERLKSMPFYHCSYFGGTGATEIVCSNGTIQLRN